MVRISSTLVGILNTVSLLISLAALGSGLYLYVHHGSDCEKLLHKPLLIMGAFLFLVSLLGIVGSCCRVTFVLYLYLTVMFLLIIFFIFFTIFVIFITNEGAGKAISGKGFKEFRLGDYSQWLQKYVINEKNWGPIKSCLVAAKICMSLGSGVNPDAASFYKKNLSPIQSGCCKPPSSCGFKFKNATYWIKPESESGRAVNDSDCTKWSNKQSQLCYDCQSCRAGMLVNIRKGWRHLAIFNACLLLFIVIVYSIGCSATRRSFKSDMGRYDRGRYNNYRAGVLQASILVQIQIQERDRNARNGAICSHSCATIANPNACECQKRMEALSYF